MLKFPRLCKKEQAEVIPFLHFQMLAELIVKEAVDKVKDKKRKTPYQRKYKKTYNATWEVTFIFNSHRVGKRMT